MPHFNKDLITVAGTYYRPICNDREKLPLLKIGTSISLEREPTNPYDQNAIKVIPRGFQPCDWIGYIPREIAKELAPILARGSQYLCVLHNIYTYRGGPRFVIQLSTFPVPTTSPKIQQVTPAMPPRVLNLEDPKSPTGKRFRKHVDIDAHIEKYYGISGVYVIWSRDYKCYIGQSKNIGARWKSHKYDLLRRSHNNEKLQGAWINNGSNYFRFDFLEKAEAHCLDLLELKYIEKFNSFFDGYNETPDGQDGEPHRRTQPPPLKTIPPSYNENIQGQFIEREPPRIRTERLAGEINKIGENFPQETAQTLVNAPSAPMSSQQIRGSHEMISRGSPPKERWGWMEKFVLTLISVFFALLILIVISSDPVPPPGESGVEHRTLTEGKKQDQDGAIRAGKSGETDEKELASTPSGLYSGLTDGLIAVFWGLPDRRELDSLLDLNNYSPALPAGHPFTSTVPANWYWTSTNIAVDTPRAWRIYFDYGYEFGCRKSDELYIRAVRGGQW